MFKRYKPQAVIHLAAKVGGVKANMAAPATFFMENITMNTHVLEAARIYGVQKVICFLSTCVFPDPCPLPLKPEHLHLGPPHPSNYGYAYAKRMLAVQCQTYNEQYGTNFVPVIPCNIYGPNDNFNLENSHVVPALIYKMWAAKEMGTAMVVWGSGRPLREFIYSEDIARLCLDLLDYYDSKTPIILSTGIEHSIRDLVFAIAKAMDFTGDIIFDTSKPEGQYRKPSDNTPLKQLFPRFKFTSLETGIAKTVKWFASVFPDIRL
jgi:GDP-L-fucose synthase